MPTERASFLDLNFDTLGVDEILERLHPVTGEGRFAYLVTPNVDHVVRLQKSDAAAELANAYHGAQYCVCDSKVLGRLARLFGIRLPVLTGTDLTELIFKHVVRAGDRIAVVGGDADLIGVLERKFPELDFRQHRPPMGLASDAAARRRAATFIADQKARFTFICVGSPQQELIAAEAAQIDATGGLALCVGAALNFLTGREARAPLAMRHLGLEWAHRLFTNPRRLWRRYLVEGPRIFLLAYRWAQRST